MWLLWLGVGRLSSAQQQSEQAEAEAAEEAVVCGDFEEFVTRYGGSGGA